jgi:hypothetical protein
MATKHDLINMAIKKGNIVGILNLCLQNKSLTDICRNEEPVQKQILKFFSDLTGDNVQLRDIATHLIFKHQISNENKLREILSFVKGVLDKRNVDTEVLIQLLKLLRKIETRKQGGWVYVNYKPEQEKLYTSSGPENALKVVTNDEGLLKSLFNDYFKVFSDFETQEIYQI